MDLEVQQHLKDCLFNGVHKHICGSVQYLHCTLRTSYSQLMVTACKAENENEEIWDKVRARVVVETDSGEGTAELRQQINKLITTLAMAGQGSSLSSAPSSPKEKSHRRGCNSSSTPVTQTSTMVGVALDR